MLKYLRSAVLVCTLLEVALPVAAMDGDMDHGVVLVECGATSAREISEQASRVSPAVGIEFEAIDNRLEVEIEASTNTTQRARNWELDLQFKRPFQISSTVEIEPGLGPSWSHGAVSNQRPAAWGAEASIDILFWQSKRIGWFLEPSYGISFATGAKTSVGLSGGIVISLL
jgi:hypothetical protein